MGGRRFYAGFLEAQLATDANRKAEKERICWLLALGDGIMEEVRSRGKIQPPWLMAGILPYKEKNIE